MKIILHFGAHKTATTHLQYNLALNRPMLENHGIKYFKFQEVKELQRLAQSLRRNTQNYLYNRKRTKKRMRAIINEEVAGFDCAILSYEAILGPLNHKNFTDIYPHAESIIKVYADILSNHEVIPLFASRDYDTFLRSTYKWCLKWASPKFSASLNDYLGNKSVSGKRWTEIADSLAKAFGSVQFYTYEDYKKEEQKVLFQIVRLTGKSIAFKQLQFDAAKKNISGNSGTLDLLYRLRVWRKKCPSFKYREALLIRLEKLLMPFADTSFGASLFPHYEKGTIPRLNALKDYMAEVTTLKGNYGLLKEGNRPK